MLILLKCSMGYALQLSPMIFPLTAADFSVKVRTEGPASEMPACSVNVLVVQSAS